MESKEKCEICSGPMNWIKEETVNAASIILECENGHKREVAKLF